MDLIGGGAPAAFILTVLFVCFAIVYALLPLIGAWVRLPWREYFNPSLLKIVWLPMLIHLSVSGVATVLYRSQWWQVEHTRPLVAVTCGTAIACTAWSHYRAKRLAVD